MISLNKLIISGALLIAAFCCLVQSYPSLTDADDVMMNDEYDYDTDDQTGSSQQTKPSSMAKTELPMANNRSTTVTGILGKDVVLKCDAKIIKSNVVLWYHDTELITNGNSVVLPNYSLNPSNFDLTILKASPQNAGNYYCQLLPQHVYLHTKVILGDHSMDVITPESSKSSQSSLHAFTLMWLLTALPMLLLQYKH